MIIENHLTELIARVIEENVRPLEERIAGLQKILRQPRVIEVKPALSLQELAEILPFSDRFITDNEEFKVIRGKVGGRVFYLWEDVQTLLRNSKDIGGRL